MNAATHHTGVPEAQWIDSVGGFGLALVGGVLVCRDPEGRVLPEIPDAVRRTDVARRLLDLKRWCVEHRRRCLRTAETWMLRALPISSDALASLWPDPAWRAAFRGAVIAPWPHAGQPCVALIEPDRFKGGLETRDGQGRPARLTIAHVQIVHPALISNADDFLEMGLDQGLDQLDREVHRRPEGDLVGQITLESFSGARFETLAQAQTLCRALGCETRGGYAACAATDDGALLEARLWIGRGDSASQTATGELYWADHEDRAVPLLEVGPVAWSEGLRMAHRILAGALLR